MTTMTSGGSASRINSPWRSDEGTTGDFTSASCDFRASGVFCDFAHSCGSQLGARTVSRVHRYQILWVRRLRGPTISGRGFNLFKPLRRHFRATPFCHQPLRFRRPKRLGSRHRRSVRRSPPGRRRVNKYRTSTQLWQARQRVQLFNRSLPHSRRPAGAGARRRVSPSAGGDGNWG
jgi:hypothetical protein